MVRLTTSSRTTDMTLSEAVANLRSHPFVEGILLLGSTGTDRLHTHSDYDLLVVVADQFVPFSLGCTWIDHRFAEIICATIATVERLPHLDTLVREDSEHGVLLQWLQTAHLAFDRAGRLEAVRRALRGRELIRLNTDHETYHAWFTINYNVQQTKRYAAAGDPLYRATVEVRLLYGLHEVFVHYFRVRHIPWHGDKDALQYLKDRDPAFFALFRQCLAESAPDHRVRLYERLAEAALAPVGPLWSEGDISIQLRPDAPVSPEVITSSVEMVNSMLAELD